MDLGNVTVDQEVWAITVVLCISFIVLLIVMLFLMIKLWRKFNKLQLKYETMIGHTGVADLEQILIEIQSKLKANQEMNANHDKSIQQLRDKLSVMKGNVAMQRYNAFGEAGSDQSFSIAFVDEQMDGLVFTAIHGREETYSYGKPLVKGESKYPLSPEERNVINLAQSKYQHHA